jgi:hypothetical protein
MTIESRAGASEPVAAPDRGDLAVKPPDVA